MITLRTPVDLLRRIDDIAESRRMTRSALVAQVLEEFVSEIQRRGYLIPPYEGDDILQDLHLNRRRQTGLGYYLSPGVRKFRS